MPEGASPPRIAVVDHGTGNLTSICRALERCGAVATRTSSSDAISFADGLVLPGVGAFPVAMAAIERLGLAAAIREFAESGRPLLGVCLGHQLLFEGSDEMGGAEGLAILQGRVVRLDPGGERLPHIGWSRVDWTHEHPLTSGLGQGVAMYHVHSFAAVPSQQADVLGTATHGASFATAVSRDNIAGVQFHPEKSSADGLSLVRNFVRWSGEGR